MTALAHQLDRTGGEFRVAPRAVSDQRRDTDAGPVSGFEWRSGPGHHAAGLGRRLGLELRRISYPQLGGRLDAA